MSSPLPQGSDEGRKPRLLFLTARQEDYRSTLDSFSFEEKLHQNHQYHFLDTPTGEIRLTHVGMGGQQTKQTLWKLRGLLDPDFLLVGGSAGALKEDLSRSSRFVPTAISHPDSEDWIHPPTDVMKWIMGIVKEDDETEHRVRSGPLLTVKSPVIEPEDRTELNQKYDALAADMESYKVIREFIDVQDPPAWGVLRIISDSFEDDSFQSIKKNQSEASKEFGDMLTRIISSLR